MNRRSENQSSGGLTEGAQEYQESMKKHMLNFLELNEEQLSSLQERVARSEGSVRIMFHPYWERFGNKKYGKTQFHKDYPLIKAVERGYEKLAMLDSELPLIVFEEGRRVDRSKAQLIKAIQAKGLDFSTRKFPIYYVPTFNGFGIPNMKGEDPASFRVLHQNNLDLSDQVSLRNWQLFNERMIKLGTKEIFIGGMMLELYHPDPEDSDAEWLHAEYPFDAEAKEEFLKEGMDTALLGQCLGNAIRELSYLQTNAKHPIKITVSNLTNPVPRRALMDLGIVVEEAGRPLLPKFKSAHKL